MSDARLRVGIAHEWLIRYAGSERCVEQLLLAYPDARLLTTVLEKAAMPEAFHRAEPSLLQRFPRASVHYQKLLPLMPMSWRMRRPLGDIDVLVSSSHACANAARAEVGIPHVSYCHTPMRYAWEFDLERDRFPAHLRPIASLAMSGFRRWDRRTSEGVNRFVANSRDVASRIQRVYGRRADVIHPPVDTEFFTPGGERGEEFLFVGRFVAYKRPDLVVEIFRDLPYAVTMIGAGPLAERLRSRATPNVSFVESVGPTELRRLMRTAKAMIFPAHEDFGIVMAESLACGTPVIALNAGGAVDIVRREDLGLLVDRQDAGQFRQAVRSLAATDSDADAIAAEAARFSESRFRAEMDGLLREVAATPTRTW